MAYVTKYTAEFTSPNDDVKRTVNLKLDGYVGASSEIEVMAADPLDLIYSNISKIEDVIIQESQLVFRFVVDQGDVSTYEELYESQYRDWLIEVREDSSIIWQGYIQPDQMSRSYIDNNIIITLTCTDGLNDTREYRFTPDVAGGFDRATIMSVLKSALSVIGIDLNFFVQVDLYEEDHGDDETCAFLQTYVNRQRFVKDKDGMSDYDTCYEVITKVLKGWNVFIRQTGGRYAIINKIRPAQDGYLIAWSNLSQGASKESVSVVDISESDTFIRGGSLTKIPPLRELDIVFFNRNIGGKVADVDFNDWSGTGPWDVNFDNATEVYSNELFMNQLRLQVDETETDTQTITLKSDFTATRVTDNDYIQLSFSYRVDNWVTDSPEPPYMFIRVHRPDGSVVDADFIHLAETPYYIAYVSPITPAFRVTDDGNYNITIEIQTLGINFDLDFFIAAVNLRTTIVEAGKPQDDVSYDRRFIATYEPGKRREETKIHFIDTLNNADLAALFALDSGQFVNTTSWWDGNYWGVDGYLPFINIYARDYLTIRQKYIDYIVVDYVDYPNVVNPGVVVEVDGKQYIVVGYQKNFRTCGITLTLVENTQDAIVMTLEQYTLSSIDGQSTRPTSVVPATTTSQLHSMIDPAYHRAGAAGDYGKFFRYNPTTGAVEVVAGVAMTDDLTQDYIPKMGAAGLVDSVLSEDSGKIGINIETPLANLDIVGLNGVASGTPTFPVRVTSGTTTNPGFIFERSDASRFISMFTGSSGAILAFEAGLNRLAIGTHAYADRYSTGYPTTEILSIKPSGRLGINAIDPSRTLDINGALRIRTLGDGAAYDSVLVADADGNVDKIAKSSLGGGGISGLIDTYVPVATGETTIGNSPIKIDGAYIQLKTLTTTILESDQNMQIRAKSGNLLFLHNSGSRGLWLSAEGTDSSGNVNFSSGIRLYSRADSVTAPTALLAEDGVIGFNNLGSGGSHQSTTDLVARINGAWVSLTGGGGVQALSGTTSRTWNVNSGLHATMTIGAATTITLSNLTAGMSGNLRVTCAATAYVITFAGYTFKVSPFVYDAASKVKTSAGSGKLDIYSFFYDGTTVYINGTKDYK